MNINMDVNNQPPKSDQRFCSGVINIKVHNRRDVQIVAKTTIPREMRVNLVQKGRRHAEFESGLIGYETTTPIAD